MTSARASPGALAHAAGKLGRVFQRRLGRKAHHAQLHGGHVVHGVGRQVGELAQGHLDVLDDRQRREQRPILKQHAPLAAHGAPRGLVGVGDVHPQHAHVASLGAAQAKDGAQQHGFSRAGTANEPQHLAGQHVQVQVLVHGHRAETVGDAPQRDDGRVRHPTPPAT